MKRCLALAGCATAVVLGGCFGGSYTPPNGTIVGKEFAPAHTDYIPVCTYYGKYGCSVWVPVPDHHGDAYSLKLKHCDGDKCKSGWRDVSAADYDAYTYGQFWPKGTQ